jgi:hypothetical protein
MQATAVHLRLYGAAEALLQNIGATGQVTVTRVQDRYLSLAVQAVGDAAFREAATKGRTMPLQRVLDMAVHRGSGSTAPGLALHVSPWHFAQTLSKMRPPARRPRHRAGTDPRWRAT